MKNKNIFILIIIVMILLAGGVYIVLFSLNKSNTDTEGEGSRFKQFLPFGNNLTNRNNNESNQEQEVDIDSNFDVTQSQKFQKITNFGIAGAYFSEEIRPLLDKDDFEIAPSVKYVEKSTGNIYQKYLDNGIEGKISNSPIPSTHEVLISGDNFIFRYLSSEKTISSFLGSLGEDRGEFLTENIEEITLSPDESKFFYLAPFSNGVTGFIRSFGENKTTQVFESPFTEWISQWVNNDNIYLTTKASYRVKGYIYKVNIKNKSFEKIFGDIYGLTTLVSPNENYILYSSGEDFGPKLKIYNTNTREIEDLNLYGLPEKCIWSTNSINIYCAIPNITQKNQPDSWYQGITSFNDHFVRIDAETGSHLDVNSSFPQENIDAIKLFFDDKENIIFFINKKDSTLWSLNIK